MWWQWEFYDKLESINKSDYIREIIRVASTKNKKIKNRFTWLEHVHENTFIGRVDKILAKNYKEKGGNIWFNCAKNNTTLH